MAKIDLFSHNEEGYNNLVASLENSNLSFLERATGTGKSYILIKYMIEQFLGKRVLFVTLHDSMFKQLTERDMPGLGVSKDMLKKLDCVLYSSIGKHSADWYYDNYDCIIFDEAHHCGAPEWSKVIYELRDLIRDSEDKKMIGATATGVRYLDNYMDVAREFFDDNVASKLSIVDAILDEILPAPYYVNNNIAVLENIEKIQRKLGKIDDFKELVSIREKVAKYEASAKARLQTNELFKKHNVKSGEKYIVFCEDIEDLKRKKEEADNWFKGIANIEKYEAHSKQNNKVNQQQIDSFEHNNNESTIKVMFAVDMFNEGLHIKGVDGIIMARRTSSPIIYLQQLGRALSFSVRKKQIKIFDLVGNANKIDIIYNLYKELLTTAKEKLKNDEINKEHYQKIIDRFKIVDEGNELLDELDAINKFLDDNYLNKEKIKRYILILGNYVYNLNENFMVLLNNHEIDKEHLKVYNELRKMSSSLSYEDYVELNKLGIVISDYQSDGKVLERIKSCGNYNNLVDLEIRDTISLYNRFYASNGRRPSYEENNDLVLNYRNYLEKMNKKQAAKYLRDVDYPLNVEELLILKDYPSLDSLNEYIESVEKKYQEGLVLDALEKRTINSVSKLVSLKGKSIALELLDSNYVIRVDGSIKILKEYLEQHPDEDFANIDKFEEQPKIVGAIKDLNSYAKYVTNKQFSVLLEMDICLPELIDMTFEERKKELGGYQSFYERDENIKKVTATAINDFIEKTGRRPNINKPDEFELAQKYDKFFYERGNAWSISIVRTLVAQQIDLTIDEKILANMGINNDDLKFIYDSIMHELNNFDENTFNYVLLKKKVNILKQYNYIDDKLYKVFNGTLNVVERIFNSDDDVEEDVIKAYLFNNQALLPFSIIDYIYHKFGFHSAKVNSSSRKSDGIINIAYMKYTEEMKKVNQYVDYIKKNGMRPESFSYLSLCLRDYLSKASDGDIKRYCDRLNELGMPLSLEEMYLLKSITFYKEKELYNSILEKRKKSHQMDALDSQIYHKLYLKFFHNYSDDSSHNKSFILDVNRDIKNDLIMELKEKIRNNPFEELDFSNLYLSKKVKEELNIYRIMCLSKAFLNNLIEKMIKLNKGYKELLDDKESELLGLIIKHSTNSGENIELVDKLNRLNKKIVLENNSINIESFINEYINFINSNGREPDIKSNNVVEKNLACNYSILDEILPTDEKIKLLSLFKKAIEQVGKSDFYTNFVAFIESNERFPSILGDSEREIELAKQYQSIGSKLSSEQKKEIKIFLKKYQMNTILYVERKKGK